jgi:lipoprotein-releasing system permease protein
LNLSHFIAQRISRGQKDGFSVTVYKIAIISIGVGLAAAIVSFLIMLGFQAAVKNKMYSFSGHIVVNKFSMNNSMEETPLSYNIDLYNRPGQFDGVRHVQEYAHKTGLIKTETEILGVFIKGVSSRFDTVTFADNMVDGRFLHFPDSSAANEVVISRSIATKLKLNVGDQVVIHFFQNPPRFRKLKIVGIYETNLSEYFDDKMIISDIRMVQRLNEWADSIAGGLEIFVDDLSKVNAVAETIGETIDYDLNITTTGDKYIQVFEWLNLVSRQVNILLVIILIVICVNMISIVLIMVMERTSMIGMLKAMGGTDGLIRKVFINSGVRLILRGLLAGNALGLGLCFIQYKFRIVGLNPHDYYISYVPVYWSWPTVIFLNVLVFAVVTLVLLIPTMAIARVLPIKAIKFD